MSKFNSKRVNGKRSKLEEEVGEILAPLRTFEYEDKYEKIAYTIQASYQPDFVSQRWSFIDRKNCSAVFPELRKTIIEVKGMFGPPERKKLLAVKQSLIQQGHWEYIDFIIVSKYESLANGLTITNKQWAEKNGFRFMTVKQLREAIVERECSRLPQVLGYSC